MTFSEAAKDMENARSQAIDAPEKDLAKDVTEVKKPALKVVRDIVVDRSRDALLTEFGKTTMEDRYLLAGESFQDMFARVARTYGDDADHAQRIYDYISKLWFMPATPVLSNGGANRGLPISCFLNGVGDSLDGIVRTWNENVALASNGGGIGTYWGGVRSIGEKVKHAGATSGIIPFIRVMDSLTLAISQGSLRRGSAACYLDVHHPEIEEFLEVDQYNELVQRAKPVIVISTHEIVRIHTMVEKHLAKLAPEADDHLRIIMKDMGPVPPLPRKS